VVNNNNKGCIVESYIYWMLSRNAGYREMVEAHTGENSDCKIMWDFTIYTSSHLAHDRQDIIVMHKSSLL